MNSVFCTRTLLFLVLCARASGVGIIEAVVGNGTYPGGYGGDGGPARNALLSSPYFPVVADDAVRMWFIDANRVRHVDAAGIIYTVAGCCSTGTFSGDGGPAVAANLYLPYGLAVDSSSSPDVTMWISDSFNHRVRIVFPNGTITTAVGGGSSSADGVPATRARLYYPRNVVVKRLATQANALVLWIAQAGGEVRFVNASGIITTVASMLGQPTGLFVQLSADELSARMWLTLSAANTVVYINATGSVSPFAGTGTSYSSRNGDGGPALNATIAGPWGITGYQNPATGGLEFYISESGGARVRRVDEEGIITTVAGTGLSGSNGDSGYATAINVQSPTGVFTMTNASTGRVDLWIADRSSYRIWHVWNNAATASPSATPSITPTTTKSVSATRTSTSTISVTPSNTPSISVTSSHTPSTSGTTSTTPSPSRSGTSTRSGTPSAWPTGTATRSGTPQSTGSGTATRSAAVTPTASVSPSTTPSFSQSATASRSRTPSASASASRSASSSGSSTTRPTQSGSASATATATTSATRTATSSTSAMASMPPRESATSSSSAQATTSAASTTSAQATNTATGTAIPTSDATA
ncbi:hypothetical protein EON62_02025, partial [archaeon]